MTGRELAFRMLIQVNEQEELSHHVLNKALQEHELSDVERGFATRLFHGTLERQLTIDWILEHQAKRPMCKVKPKIRNLLRISAYQLLFLQQVPASAVCNEAVKLAKKCGLAGLSGFVNGVLRGLSREIVQAGGQEAFLHAFAQEMTETERLCFLYSMPVWLVSYWRNAYPKRSLEPMLQAFLEEGGVSIRQNKSRGSMEELKASLEQEGVAYTPGILPNTLRIQHGRNLAELRAYREGRFSIQDESSAFAGNVLPLQQNMKVLDVCAAPGGKSVHVADELSVLGGGEVEARDLREQKIAKIAENLKITGLTNVTCVVKDATHPDPSKKGWADIVLADLPCSGLGVIGRKPDIKWKTSYEDILSLAEIQKKILKQAVTYVKSGGYLCYSTCTITKEENADMCEYIKKLKLQPVSLAEMVCDGMDAEVSADGAVQLFPGVGGTDGFFVALFRRE